MRKATNLLLYNLFIGLFCLTLTGPARAQNSLPAAMDSASMKGQMNYLNEKTRVYNNYRAIREDIFQKLRKNVNDSIAALELDIVRLQRDRDQRDNEINTLNAELERVKADRDEAIRNRDSITVLGLQLGKGVYNSTMWILVLALAITAIVLFTMFKQRHVITRHTRKELEKLQEEYDDYRKNAREKYEKLTVSHHQELMKLKQK